LNRYEHKGPFKSESEAKNGWTFNDNTSKKL
jgi:hypothetical protein